MIIVRRKKKLTFVAVVADAPEAAVEILTMTMTIDAGM